MTRALPRHTVAPATLDALAAGGGGEGAVRALVAARRSRTLGLLRLSITGDPDATAAFRALGAVRAAAPAAVDRVLDDPLVGAWATARAVRGHGRAADLAWVAAAAAVRAGVPAVLSFPPTRAGVLPSLGTATTAVAGRHRTDTLPWSPFPVLRPGGAAEVVAADWPPDLLPADLGACPPPPRWAGRVAAGWALLARDHPDAAAETAAITTTATALAPPPGSQTSATLADALGCVFLSAGDDPEATAATLTHETQHAKLTAVMDLHPLTAPCADTFYAPWRPDPRPLPGLLHGTYAHLGVTAFWHTRRATGSGPHADREFARWRAAVTATAAVLATAPLTAVGRRFVAGIAAAAARFARVPVPTRAEAEAEDLLRAHRARFEHRWGLEHRRG
ncbi:aKG-HExxH-type peptide beta-hydroxylase [Actinokineospora spheciospongiae]|uniref:aKG-HExxH-type peptide beta-hydroxylase n=1 Tax=Actinokineospora spheciospongiae TaxID=909613 RepID=UPI000D86235B|nr:HEXXH motif-containing putative peptide modification protein [Actinokineospora spheciospongiae]PWW63574.1 HEXXH motif-containing protein [Actinokineospora spheciospongiae]